ncbi:unnamed protein product [Prunus brigantina]
MTCSFAVSNSLSEITRFGCKDGPAFKDLERWNKDLTCSRKGFLDINNLKHKIT